MMYSAIESGRPPDHADSPLTAQWCERLKGKAVRVGLGDGEDPRAVRAALALHEAGQLAPRLVGRRALIERAVEARIPPELILDTDELAAESTVARALDEALSGRSEQERRSVACDPVHLAAAALRAGVVDCCLAGATRPTADVLRAGIRVVGLQEHVGTLSSSFLMVLPGGRALTFADCAVLPDPDERQLADIAIAAAETHRALAATEPLVAMLSFSTLGSAEHEVVSRVRSATHLVRERMPEVIVDGEPCAR